MKNKTPCRVQVISLMLLLLASIAFASLALAQTATLTLVNQVINDDGGTAVSADFTLYANGPAYITGISGESTITNAIVPAGNYYLDSFGVTGYDDTWECDGASLSGYWVSLVADTNVTCTVTQNDNYLDLLVWYLRGLEYTRNGVANVRVDILNNGVTPSGSYQVSFLRSTDDIISTSDTEIDSITQPGLAAGDFDLLTHPLEFPSDPDQTTPYWGVCIIYDGEETSNINNCSYALYFPVESGPSAPSVCSVSQINCGESVFGSMTANDCELGPRGTPVGNTFEGTPGFLAKEFTFQGTAGQTVSVFADWLDTVDGYLYLEDPSGLIETFNDDFEGIALSLIGDHVLEQTGTYTVWTTTYSQYQLGDFELSLSCDGVISDPVYINEFTASPSQISEGGEVTLSWVSEGASQCTGRDGVAAWQGEKGTTGSQSVVVEASGANTFQIDCSNVSGGQASATATVEVLGNNPDLDLDTLTLSSYEVSPSEVLTATAIFKNTGDGIAPASTVRWYLSDNEAISDDDLLSGSDTLASLSPGENGTEARTGTAPSSSGTYWVAVCVEPVDGEPDTINNCSPGAPLSVISNASCNISGLECGSTNTGGLGSQDCQSGPLGPGHLATAHNFEGAAGQSFILDVDWAGADGYLALQAPDGVIVSANDDFGDSTRSRIEHTLEQNGTYTAWLTTFRPGTEPVFNLTMACPDQYDPNLSVALRNGPPEELEVGERFQVEFDVSNIGDSTAGSSTLRYLLSTDPSVTTSDSQLASSSTSSLAPNAGLTRSATLAVNEPGDYWIGACVDAIEGESLGENNCSESQQITVRSTNNCSTNVIEIGGGASGTLGSGDCDKSPRGAAFRGESFSFDGYRGQDIAVAANWNNFDGYLYLEGPDGKIVTQNDDATSQLSANLTRKKQGGNIMSQNVEATDNSSSEVRAVLEETGTYKVWATSYSPETTGSFELTSGEFLACQEVLIIDSIAVDKSVVGDGEQITASTQLRSVGCADAQESLLRYFISSNSVITSGDAEVGRDVIESLPQGDSGIEHVLVEAPVTSGKYWIGACINEINDDCVVSEAIEVQSDVESIPFNSGMSDAWYNPDQAGQGILISVIPSRNLIFMAWFTFDNELPPANTWSNLGDAGHRWMTAYGTYQGNSATLNVEWTRGGVFNSSSPPMQQSNSGTVQIQFTDCNKGTLQYDIPDIDQQGTIEIERVTRENLHLCESGITDTQQLANSVNIEIDQDQIRTGESMNLMWQAPSDLNCVSIGGNDSWADGIELDDSGSYEVRIGTEGDLEFGMNCSGGSSTQSNVRAGAHVTALNTEEEQPEKHGQKVLFNPGLNDAWYDPSLPGQGLLLTVFPDTKLVFLAWFTFDTARPPGNTPFNMGDPGHRWMTAYGFYEDDTVQLKIERTRGGIFDSVEPKVTQEDYGTLDLSFDDCNSGELIYNIPSAGLNGAIPLERVVADKVGECETQDGFDQPIDVQKEPLAKDLLPNSCGGSYTWNFEWEEQQGFQLYQIEIRNGRSDQPVYRDSVLGTELTITKTEVITTEYLTGWSWRVRAISSTVGGPWSEDREFNVAPVTSCN